jgi:hypothetical protein
MDLTTTVLINILSSLLFALLGAVAYRFTLEPLQRRVNVLSRLLPLSVRGAPIVLCYACISRRSKHNRHMYTVEDGDVAALIAATTLLRDNYSAKRLIVINQFVTEATVSTIKNLLCVGGPGANQITERYIGVTGSPVWFDRTPGSVAVSSDGSVDPSERLMTTFRESGEPAICHGVIIAARIKNAIGQAQNVVICAGYTTLGTYGAVLYLHRLENCRRVPPELRSLRSGNRWAIVLRVCDRAPVNAERASGLPVNPGYIDLSITHALSALSFRAPYDYQYNSSTRELQS